MVQRLMDEANCGGKIDGKAKSENDKGSLGTRLIHYPLVRGFFFCKSLRF